MDKQSGSKLKDSNQLVNQPNSSVTVESSKRELEVTTDDYSREEDHLDSHDKSGNPKSTSSPRPSTVGGSSKVSGGYFSDYLQRMSRQERRRIQREIQKGRKPGEPQLHLYRVHFGLLRYHTE